MDISTQKLNVLSLCSGGGGLDLGLRLALPNARTVCYVENEITACSLLAQHMEQNLLPAAPIWSDLRSFDATVWRGCVDILTGGYPCQPFSLAGKRAGESDERHLWPFIARIIRDCEPTWCFFENVPGHLTLGYATVKAELESMGYRVKDELYSAAETGASQLRKRLYILAYSDSVGRWTECQCATSKAREIRNQSVRRDAILASTGGQKLQGREWGGSFGERDWTQASRSIGELRLPYFPPHPDDYTGWLEVLKTDPLSQPSLCRMVDGMASRMDGVTRADRLRILGNGVVPIAAAFAFAELVRKMCGED